MVLCVILSLCNIYGNVLLVAYINDKFGYSEMIICKLNDANIQK
jgi:hypothetical protein